MASAGDVVLGIFMPQQQAGQPETYSVVGRGASAFDEAVSRAASAKAKIKVPNIFVPLQVSRSCRLPLIDGAQSAVLAAAWPQSLSPRSARRLWQALRDRAPASSKQRLLCRLVSI